MVIDQVSDHHTGSDSSPWKILPSPFLFPINHRTTQEVKRKCQTAGHIWVPKWKQMQSLPSFSVSVQGKRYFCYPQWECWVLLFIRAESVTATQWPSRRTKETLLGFCWSQWCTQTSTNLTVGMVMFIAYSKQLNWKTFPRSRTLNEFLLMSRNCKVYNTSLLFKSLVTKVSMSFPWKASVSKRKKMRYRVWRRKLNTGCEELSLYHSPVLLHCWK